MKLMKTAEEMYMYCVENQTNGADTTPEKSLDHFRAVQDAMDGDEYALSCFMGLHNYVSISRHENEFAYAVTDRRVIMGQKQTISSGLKIIPFTNLNDIIVATGTAASILIDADSGQTRVKVNNQVAENIKKKIEGIMLTIKKKKYDWERETMLGMGTAEDIRQFKTLLDEGIITEGEFSEKKKQILTNNANSSKMEELRLDIDKTKYNSEQSDTIAQRIQQVKAESEERSEKNFWKFVVIGTVLVVLGGYIIDTLSI